MSILTKKNGIALIAVLAVLLVLTLLIPAMFTMSENATRASIGGQDEQRASYFARTMIEFSVSAFQECYDSAEEDESNGFSIPEDESEITDELKQTDLYKLNQFLKKEKKMNVSVLYIYRNSEVNFPNPDEIKYPEREAEESDAHYRKRCLALYSDYMDNGVIYSTIAPSGYTEAQVLENKVPRGTKTAVSYIASNGEAKSVTGVFLGYARCSVEYDDSVNYYKTWKDGEGAWQTELIEDDNAEQQYKNYLETAKSLIASNNQISDSAVQIFKVTNKNVVFSSRALVNGKAAIRRCILVLPTKPSDNSWVIPANIESNQIFPDTGEASGVVALSMNNSSYFIDGEAINGQPVYGYSCIGNMVMTAKNLKYKVGENDYLGYPKGSLVNYTDYVEKYNTKAKSQGDDLIANRLDDFSFGLHPETTTIKPAHDPAFNCLKTNNMRSWATSAQRDNFIAYTATNGIQFDLPVNVIMNPCRTGRIGDGISKNKSLYKVLYLQAPTIVFNDTVNSFISLYTKNSLSALLLDYNAYRMSTIILAAPESTPYTMEVEKNGRITTVKAGKVYFAEDAYVWLIPYAENGSNYKTQSVYYKGKDIILYKFANAGDVYLFNAEVETKIDGKMQKAGFSMTNYFMDVIYSKDTTDTNNLKWWQLWSGIQSIIFDSAVNGLREKTYEAQDLQWVGNMNTGSQGAPNVDDFYVVWES